MNNSTYCGIVNDEINELFIKRDDAIFTLQQWTCKACR